jgi:hypothetical protein
MYISKHTQYTQKKASEEHIQNNSLVSKFKFQELILTFRLPQPHKTPPK